MTDNRPLARAQRLALVFRGAGTRWALPAEVVREVGPAPAEAGERRSGLPVEIFSELFGERYAPEPKSVTLVVDAGPARALVVEGVDEVADLAAAPFFGLPPTTSGPTCALLRGVVLHGGRLVLELLPDKLCQFATPAPSPPPRAVQGRPGDVPTKALVFEAGEGDLLGVALPFVTGVVRAGQPCRLPLSGVGHVGLIHHERSILPLYDLSLRLGRAPTRPDLAVTLDVSGAAIAAASSHVLGVVEGFGGPEPLAGGVAYTDRVGRKVMFPDLESWWSAKG